MSSFSAVEKRTGQVDEEANEIKHFDPVLPKKPVEHRETALQNMSNAIDKYKEVIAQFHQNVEYINELEREEDKDFEDFEAEAAKSLKAQRDAEAMDVKRGAKRDAKVLLDTLRAMPHLLAAIDKDFTAEVRGLLEVHIAKVDQQASLNVQTLQGLAQQCRDDIYAVLEPKYEQELSKVKEQATRTHEELLEASRNVDVSRQKAQEEFDSLSTVHKSLQERCLQLEEADREEQRQHKAALDRLTKAAGETTERHNKLVQELREDAARKKSRGDFVEEEYRKLVESTEDETRKLVRSQDQAGKELREEHQRLMELLKAEQERAHDVAIAELGKSHKAALDEQERSHMANIRRLGENHKSALDSLQEEHNRELEHFKQQIDEVKTQKRSAHELLQEAVHFQATSSQAAELDLGLVDEITDLVARSRQSTGFTTTIELDTPVLIFCSKRMSFESRSPCYGFWLTSRSGSAKQVFENADAIFNKRQSTLENAAQTPWIQGALEQLLGRFILSTSRDQDNVKVGMVALQAIAYLRCFLVSYDPSPTMTRLERFIDSLDDGFIIASMHRRVAESILREQPIISCIQSTGLANRMLDHTNSDLAEGVYLVADNSGMFIMGQTKQTTILYVFSKDDIEALLVYVRDGRRVLNMKPNHGLPTELQSLTLASKVQAIQVHRWTRTYLASSMTFCPA